MTAKSLAFAALTLTLAPLQADFIGHFSSKQPIATPDFHYALAAAQLESVHHADTLVHHVGRHGDFSLPDRHGVVVIKTRRHGVHARHSSFQGGSAASRRVST